MPAMDADDGRVVDDFGTVGTGLHVALLQRGLRLLIRECEVIGGDSWLPRVGSNTTSSRRTSRILLQAPTE